jgi:nitrogen fixation protein NifU and related proteins
MYSPQVLDHLDNPRNVGSMAEPSASGQASNPVCGDVVHIFLKIDHGTIAAASFEAQGCPPTIAASSILTEMVTGLGIENAGNLRPADVTGALGGLPRNKEHCSLVAIDALRAALKNLDPNI